jgi:hypothetical protein
VSGDATRFNPGLDWISADLAKVLSHPLRIKILGEVNLNVISPNGFRLKYDLPLPKVAYHFRELEKAGCLEVVSERRVRGSMEHFYAATRRALLDEDTWERLPQGVKAGLSARVLASLFGVVSRSLAEQTFDSRKDRHLTWDQQDLDEQGWQELQTVLMEALEKSSQARDEARQRIADGASPTVRATWALMGFESPPLQQGSSQT